MQIDPYFEGLYFTRWTSLTKKDIHPQATVHRTVALAVTIFYSRVSHLPQNASTGLTPLNWDLPIIFATVWRIASSLAE